MHRDFAFLCKGEIPPLPDLALLGPYAVGPNGGSDVVETDLVL